MLSFLLPWSGCRGQAGSGQWLPGAPEAGGAKRELPEATHQRQTPKRKERKSPKEPNCPTETDMTTKVWFLGYVFFTEKIIHKLTYKNVQTHE